MFSNLTKESIGSIQFNRQIIKMISFDHDDDQYHIIFFKSHSDFFCLDLKITISVFFTVREMLLAFNQLKRCLKSVLINVEVFQMRAKFQTVILPCSRQIPLATGKRKMQISCIQSSYLIQVTNCR